MRKDPINTDPTRQADMLKALLGLIEEVRYKRQNEWRDQLHPKGHRFTQLELKQVALPTYGNLLASNSKRLPARQQILDVADYLECTIAETNDLLLCAQYLPERETLTPQAYQNLLNRAKMLTHLIPLPAAVLKPDVEVVYATQSLLDLNSLPPLAKLSREECLGGSWYLNASLPSAAFYNITPSMTHANARAIAEMMWLGGQNHRHESWFKASLQQCSQFPKFEQHWHALASESISLGDEDYGNCVMQTPFIDTPIQEGTILLPLNHQGDLTLLISIPKDDAALHVYRQLGCQLDDMRWEAVLQDLGESV